MTTLDQPAPIIGVTHLIIDGNLVMLLKCPFCNSLRNIHVEEIENHIRLTHPERSYHVSDFFPKGVRGSSPYSPYITKEEIKLPKIGCLWCDYSDQKEFDLSLHFLEKYKNKLMQIPITSRDRKKTKSLLEPRSRFLSKFEPAIEFRLDVAIEIARQGRGVQYAIRSIQRRILDRRTAKDKEEELEVEESGNRIS